MRIPATVIAAPAALLLSAACVAQTAAQPAADRAAALLVEMRAACGGNAWDQVQGWHETGRIDLPGRPGVPYDAYHDMHELKSTYINRVDGRIVRHGGYDGSVSWQVGPDGQVRTNRDPAALRRSRRDTYLSSFGWFFPERFPAEFVLVGVETREGRTYDVLRVTPTEAASADLWVDRETHRIGRFVAEQEFAELTDYRSFDGICTPTNGHQGDGDPAHAIVLHVETVETGPVDPSIFIPPAPAAHP